MKEMGTTYILVIEPQDFTIQQNTVSFNDFGFVISSQSQWYRDLMSQLIKKCYSVRMKYFGSHILTEIQKNLEQVGRKSPKSEADMLKLVATFFDIAYYTAVGNNKNAHFRTFSTVMGSTLYHFLYVGSIDYDGVEILEKIQNKCEMNGKDTGSCFEVIPISQ